MLVRVAAGDIIHPCLHVGLGRESDNGHSGGRRHHWEIGQQLFDKPELVNKVGMAHAGRLIHQEDHVQVVASLPQPSDVLLEGLTKLLHFVLCTLSQLSAPAFCCHVKNLGRSPVSGWDLVLETCPAMEQSQAATKPNQA